MEFAELIKVSRLDNVRLRRPGQERCEVTVAVTGHHLILSLEESEEAGHEVRKRSADQNLRIKLYYDESVYK